MWALGSHNVAPNFLDELDLELLHDGSWARSLCLIRLFRILIGLDILEHGHNLMFKLLFLNPDPPSHRVELIFDLILAHRPDWLVGHLCKQLLELLNFLWIV